MSEEKLDGATVLITADDGSLPVKPGESVEDILRERAPFELDVYYPWLAPFTMRTEFVSVSVDEVQVWRKWNRGATLFPTELKVMSGLRNRLDRAIKLFQPPADVLKQEQACHPLHRTWGAFVRLCTRSPKDAVDKMETQLLPRLALELDTLALNKRSNSSSSSTTTTGTAEQQHEKKADTKKGKAEELSDDDRMLALRRSFMRVMKVQTGDEALQIFMNSYRTISDLKRAVDFLDQSPSWNMKLIVREFVDMDPAYEFRGFVHNKKLTALSQYFSDSSFSYVTSNTNSIPDRAREFFTANIAPLLPDTHANCILDFVVAPGRVYVVELNPWSIRTGPCLFDWEADLNVLREGPFEFRFVRPEQSQAKHHLLPWKHLFQSEKSS
jgi:hypothetical protein